MVPYNRQKISQYLATAQNAPTNFASGRAYEQLAAYLFDRVPGVSILDTNTLTVDLSEEIDISYYNDQRQNGFVFLPPFGIIECKNWSRSVGSAEVNWFDTKMKDTNSSHGFLIAANGISGDAAGLTRSHQIIATALREGRYLIVIKDEEINGLTDTDELVELTRFKIGQLKCRRTCL